VTLKPLLAAFGTLVSASVWGADLRPGDAAPSFALVGSDGKTYRLSDYKDKQVVVLAWFPKAFTSG
jgi:peroxiredoxin Q/BCP